MKKVIPKKKDAFPNFDDSKVSELVLFQSPSFQSFSVTSSSPSFQSSIIIEESFGIAGENIHIGDMLMVRKKDGLIVPFTGGARRAK